MQRGKLLILLLSLITVKVTGQPSLLGHSGLITIPTAVLPEDGTVTVGSGYIGADYANLEPGVNPEVSSNISMMFYPFIEIGAGVTTPWERFGSWGIGDRKGTIRVRILSERQRCPAILIGTHDPINTVKWIHGSIANTQYFQANYVVISKHFGLSANNILGAHLGYGVQLARTKNYQFQGVFGGISISHKEWMELLLEFDGIRPNVGVRTTIFRKIHLSASLLGIKGLAGSLSYKTYL